MNKKIVICSGGTGGHVIPAINLGNFLINNGYSCYLVLDRRGEKFCKNFKGNVHIINSYHLSGGFFFKLKSIIVLLIGFIKSLIFIFKVRPSISISFGSYAVFMPLLSILILKFFKKHKMYIHEQNSIIGKVNLFFLPFAEKIFTNFKYIKDLKKKYFVKTYHVGLPLSSNIHKNIPKKNNINNKKIIFIYGGSQGSVNIINSFLLLFKKIDYRDLNNLKLIIQSPKAVISKVKQTLKILNIDFEIKEFYNNIDEILLLSDMAITRAGAGTINDIIKYKIPSIIVPIPNSINDHQVYNAKYLSDVNAAILMNEEKINTEINLKIFIKLISDKVLRETIKKNLKKLILKDANSLILNKIL